MKAVCISLLCCSALAAATITQPKFFARHDYGSSVPGVGAQGLVSVADINGDGIPDIVATESFHIYTLLGNGNGTFRTGPTTDAGYYQLGNAVPIDLNGDGKIDLVVGGGPTGGAGLGVCFGNGDGTFQPPVVYPVGGASSSYVVVGDFNGDGIPDAALVGVSGLWIFLGKGGGAFNPGVLIPIANISSPPIAADFNGDGKLDLAIGVGASSPAFLVLYGNGDGTFQTPVAFPTPAPPGWLAAGDLNRDGRPDLAAGSWVFLNNGEGGFGPPIAFNLPGAHFAIADVNGDHIPDLVSELGYVAMGLGNGHFAQPKYYPVASALGANNVVPADLRKKGLTDLVVGLSNSVSVLLNEGKGTFEEGEEVPLANSGNCGAAADFNGDGIPDLAVPTTTGIVILLGTGKATAPYTTGTTIPLSGPGCPISGDVNGDGIPDILEGASSLGGVGVYLGKGDGTFTLASVIPLAVFINMVLGDFNHDGKQDVATSSNQLALGNGDGTFQAPMAILPNPPTLGFNWVAAGDVNNDGWSDLVATGDTDSGGAVYVLVNNQQGGFTVTTINDAGATAVMLGDLNGDGNLDAAVDDSYQAQIFLGDGRGGLKLQANTIAYPGPNILPPQIGDVNGDGIPDLILPANGSIGIALGRGNGTFVPPFAVGAGGGMGQVFLENQHGQSPTAGLPDLISPDGAEVWVLLNLTK